MLQLYRACIRLGCMCMGEQGEHRASIGSGALGSHRVLVVRCESSSFRRYPM